MVRAQQDEETARAVMEIFTLIVWLAGITPGPLDAGWAASWEGLSRQECEAAQEDLRKHWPDAVSRCKSESGAVRVIPPVLRNYHPQRHDWPK
jgi:hypothetical protein